MKLSKLASFVSLLGLMVASTVETKAVNPPNLDTGTLTFALTATEQVKDEVPTVGSNYTNWTSTVTSYAVGNAQIISFIGSLIGSNFTAQARLVYTNGNIYIRTGTNSLNVSDFFSWDSDCWSLYTGIQQSRATYQSEAFTSFYISYLYIELPCGWGTEVSEGGSDYIDLSGVTTDIYSNLYQIATALSTSTSTRVSTGFGSGIVDGDRVLLRGSIVQTRLSRWTY